MASLVQAVNSLVTTVRASLLILKGLTRIILNDYRDKFYKCLVLYLQFTFDDKLPMNLIEIQQFKITSTKIFSQTHKIIYLSNNSFYCVLLLLSLFTKILSLIYRLLIVNFWLFSLKTIFYFKGNLRDLQV